MNRSNLTLPTPNFDAGPITCVAGLRPWRKGGYRLEAEFLGSRLQIHNYGHGGAGITMSWGCAEEVADMVVSYGFHPPSTPVAILGAGVMGLTSATVLLEAGYSPVLYAKETSRRSTSSISGGPWSPSVVDHQRTHAGEREFGRILRRAFRAHERRIGHGFGVVRRDLYTLERSANMAKVPRDVIPEPEELSRLPFDKLMAPGFRYRTLLIEPLTMLSRLEENLLAAGIKVMPRTFECIEDVASLPEPVVINCTGLGSKAVWPDPNLTPLKGHLAMLPPQPDLEYLFSDARHYVFPRSDSMVIGGTYTAEDDPAAHMNICQSLVQKMKDTFG